MFIVEEISLAKKSRKLENGKWYVFTLMLHNGCKQPIQTVAFNIQALKYGEDPLINVSI